MADSYRILFREGEGEYEEKKSRFLAVAFPIASEQDAQERLALIRKTYWGARHHCYAYTLGENGEISRFSDDGEPGGTAGRPILDVVLGSGVRNFCIVVTRYFGGTLLGTGGLVRAYGTAARAALETAAVLTVENGEEWSALLDYGMYGKVERVAQDKGFVRGETTFADDVTLHFFLRRDQVGEFERTMVDITQDNVVLNRERALRFAAWEGKVVLL